MSANYVNIAGGTTYTLTVNPATLTLQNNQFRLVCKTDGGAITINLPAISAFGTGIDSKIFIEDADDMSSVNNITVVVDESNTIDNASSLVINTDGEKIEIYISSHTEFGVLGASGAGGVGAAQDTLIGIGAYGEYPLANNPSGDLTADGIRKAYAILELMTAPVAEVPSNLVTISFPDLVELYGGINFTDDETALLESVSFPLLAEPIVSLIVFANFLSLNNISFPALTKIIIKPNSSPFGGFALESNAAITSFSLPLLTDIESYDPLDTDAGGIAIRFCPLLESISFPLLENMDNKLFSFSTFTELPACTSINFDSLKVGSSTGLTGFQFVDMLLLPTLSFPAALTNFGFSADNCAALTSISAPLLTTGHGLQVIDCPLLTSISFPLLTTAENPTILIGVRIDDNATLPSLSFPALASSDLIVIRNNSLLVSILFPALTTTNEHDFTISNNPLLLSFSIPTLTDVNSTTGFGGVFIGGNDSLLTLDISGLLNVNKDIFISANAALTTVSINSGLNSGTLIYTFTANALTEATVDDILDKLDIGGLSNGTLALDGGTNATPSAAGLVSKVSLEGKGWTVTNN